MQERVEALNEKLDLVLSGLEKFTDGELFAEGGSSKPGYSKKQCKLMHCILYIPVITVSSSILCHKEHVHGLVEELMLICNKIRLLFQASFQFFVKKVAYLEIQLLFLSKWIWKANINMINSTSVQTIMDVGTSHGFHLNTLVLKVFLCKCALHFPYVHPFSFGLFS